MSSSAVVIFKQDAEVPKLLLDLGFGGLAVFSLGIQRISLGIQRIIGVADRCFKVLNTSSQIVAILTTSSRIRSLNPPGSFDAARIRGVD